MSVTELARSLELTLFALPEAERDVTGGYAGDLLSWVMGSAQRGDAWMTIMSNRNIVAVATLTDVACIILAEGVQPDEGVAELANERGVNLLGSSRSAYELCVGLGKLL